MARNVRFIRTTKEKWLKRDSYDPLALYFCEDTQEMCKGDQVLTDGIRVVPTKADLPACPLAADGVIYYIAATKSGYMMSPDRTEWLQTIYAPVEDVTTIPEDEVYNTVTTVGAVRDIENAIYTYIDQEIAKVEVSGSVGKDGLSAYEVWLNDGHTGTESDFLNWLKGKDGVDGKDGINGVDGKDGVNGADGKTPYIQNDYWYIDGVNTNIKAKGTDGVNGKDGADGKDGLNGKDGASGKDGKSAYEIWIEAGHSGSEDDFLQWLKGDTEPFGNVVTSISCNGIAAGTSLNGKTVKDVLVMLLGIQEAPKSIVEYIMDNRISAYTGTMSSSNELVEYELLDADSASYSNQGFYTTTDGDGAITSAGYQLTIPGNNNADAQIISIPADAVIKMAYRYDLGGTNTWLPYTFDTTDEANYWLLGDSFSATINGEEVVYQTYVYNIDVVGGGDAITSTEYWRFEIEVAK